MADGYYATGGLISPSQLGHAQVQALLEQVTEAGAHHALWHYGPRRGVMEPGSFFQALQGAIAQADPHNRMRLALVFPSETAAATLIEGHPDGLRMVQELAGIAAS